MAGVKCTMHIKELPGKKVACAFLVDKHPEYNSMTLTTEDVDNCVDLAMFGGKATIKYSRTAKGYTSVVTTEKMGKWEYEEEYSEQGFKNVSYTSYSRRQKVSSYRYIKQYYPNFQRAEARNFLSFFCRDFSIKAVV